jgi:hypothetical protein
MPRGVYERKPVSKVPNLTGKSVDATSDMIEGREREYTVADVLANGQAPLQSAHVDIATVTDLSEAQFMEELVEIVIQGDHHDGAENGPVWLGVNGECLWVHREIPVKVKRKHIGALLDARTGTMRQQRIIAPDGSQGYVERETTGLSYPFSVISDPNPRGAMWLREMMRRPA